MLNNSTPILDGFTMKNNLQTPNGNGALEPSGRKVPSEPTASQKSYHNEDVDNLCKDLEHLMSESKNKILVVRLLDTVMSKLSERIAGLKERISHHGDGENVEPLKRKVHEITRRMNNINVRYRAYQRRCLALKKSRSADAIRARSRGHRCRNLSPTARAKVLELEAEERIVTAKLDLERALIEAQRQSEEAEAERKAAKAEAQRRSARSKASAEIRIAELQKLKAHVMTQKPRSWTSTTPRSSKGKAVRFTQ